MDEAYIPAGTVPNPPLNWMLNARLYQHSGNTFSQTTASTGISMPGNTNLLLKAISGANASAATVEAARLKKDRREIINPHRAS